MSDAGEWQFWIDRGGTFTDIVARRPDGGLRHAEAAVRESRALSRRGDRRHPRHTGPRAGRADSRQLPSRRSRWARPSRPTRCWSARASARCSSSPRASATRCASAIRTGRSCSTRHIVLPELLYERVVEVEERVTAEGEVLRALDPDAGARRSCGGLSPPASARSRSSSCTAIAIPRMSARSRSSRARWASPRFR